MNKWVVAVSDFPHKLILTDWGWEKMADIFQTTFSNAFSWMKMYKFWLRFHWSLFRRVQLTISHSWFRLWLGTHQATSHYLNQWWSNLLTHVCDTRPQWGKFKSHKMSFAHSLCLTCQILFKLCIFWYCCCALCKISKEFDNCNGFNEWPPFHKNRIFQEFRREIIYCNSACKKMS